MIKANNIKYVSLNVHHYSEECIDCVTVRATLEHRAECKSKKWQLLNHPWEHKDKDKIRGKGQAGRFLQKCGFVSTELYTSSSCQSVVVFKLAELRGLFGKTPRSRGSNCNRCNSSSSCVKYWGFQEREIIPRARDNSKSMSMMRQIRDRFPTGLRNRGWAWASWEETETRTRRHCRRLIGQYYVTETRDRN